MIEEIEKEMGKFYFIAHTFQDVLIGENCDNQYKIVKKAFSENVILEAHFFNKNQEIFFYRENGKIKRYKTLIHDEKKKFNDRFYVLDKKVFDNNNKLKYNTLQIREYINFDKKSHLAYVDKTILYKLYKRS